MPLALRTLDTISDYFAAIKLTVPAIVITIASEMILLIDLMDDSVYYDANIAKISPTPNTPSHLQSQV